MSTAMVNSINRKERWLRHRCGLCTSQESDGTLPEFMPRNRTTHTGGTATIANRLGTRTTFRALQQCSRRLALRLRRSMSATNGAPGRVRGVGLSCGQTQLTERREGAGNPNGGK